MNITIVKKTLTSVDLGNGKELNIGDEVVFIANGICQYGFFKGLTRRGCLQFNAKVGDAEVTWNVLAKSIQELEVLN